MIVEIRQRLGAMNIYIPDSEPSTQAQWARKKVWAKKFVKC